MATRVEVFLACDLANPAKAGETLDRLNAVHESSVALRGYWRSLGGAFSELDQWVAGPPSNRVPNVLYYMGPGMLGLHVTAAAARIGAELRWYDFLHYDDARRVHLEAFRSVAIALRASSMAICADTLNDDANDRFNAGGSYEECVDALRTSLGPPQPSVDILSPDVVAEAKAGSPRVWFLG